MAGLPYELIGKVGAQKFTKFSIFWPKMPQITHKFGLELYLGGLY